MSDSTKRAQTPFTSEHFVAFLTALLGRPYWYGTCAYKCTNSLLARKTEQYPSHYKASRTATYKRHIAANEVCADCIGAAKGYAWTDGGRGVIEAIGTEASIPNRYGSNGCPDRSVSGMFAYAKDKGMPWGVIATIPEVPGLAVTRSGHVGYYVGGGEVIEFAGFSKGCVRTRLESGDWVNWYCLPFIDYGDADVTNPAHPSQPAPTLGSRMLKNGSTGEDVRQLQKILVSLGCDLGDYGSDGDGADGKFGSITEKAVRRIQGILQVTVDGKYGSVTHAALMGLLEEREEEQQPDGEPDEQPDTPDDAFDDAQQTEPEAVQPKAVVVTIDKVNVRSGPSTAYKVITRVNAGDTLPYVATAHAQQWHAVEVNGKIGWLCGEYATLEG